MEKAEMYAWDITNILVGDNVSNEKIWENGEKSTIAAAILCVVVDNAKRPEFQNLTNVYWFVAEMCKTVGNKTPMTEYVKKLKASHPARALLSISDVAPSRTKGSFYTSALWKACCKIGRKKTAVIGLTLAVISDVLLVVLGNLIPIVIIAIGLMGLGFMLAHSTFLAIATEFAAKARGIAMSLVAFFFMGGGGIGTAIGGRIVAASSFERLFTIYGAGLLLLTIAALLVKKSFQANMQTQRV